ncbi:chorismate synthase [Synechococcus sp. RS9916]|nr:chorismate synthase [Synechococcus sp. RS9916]
MVPLPVVVLRARFAGLGLRAAVLVVVADVAAALRTVLAGLAAAFGLAAFGLAVVFAAAVVFAEAAVFAFAAVLAGAAALAVRLRAADFAGAAVAAFCR